MAGSGKWARTVVITGSPDALDDDQLHVVVLVRKHFYRQDGYLGSHLSVDRDNGIIRSTGFWESREALERTDASARSLGETMAKTIWGHSGHVQVEVSEVLVLDPPPVSVTAEDPREDATNPPADLTT